MRNDPIGPADYVEPRCLLCDEPYGAPPSVKPIPQQRVLQKMNEYMNRRDYDGALRHLQYWLEEAQLGGDQRGELLVYNELIGHYRKTGNREGALHAAEEALRLTEELGFASTVSGGTTYVNAATACNAFGQNERSLALFEKARAVYESQSDTDPSLLGGLYNNMALTCVALGRFDRANELYQKALTVMERVPGGGLEQAITYLNMADAVEARHGAQRGESAIFTLLDKAYDLLARPDAPQNGYYAFVCEKCAPAFAHYGYFAAAKELNERAEAIYART